MCNGIRKETLAAKKSNKEIEKSTCSINRIPNNRYHKKECYTIRIKRKSTREQKKKKKALQWYEEKNSSKKKKKRVSYF